MSDADRAVARSDVAAAMAKLFPPRRYSGAASGGIILRVSDGTPPDPQELNRDGPGMCDAWREMVAKACEFSRAWAAEIRVRELAAQITVEQLNSDLEDIRTWANSLRRTS